MFRRLRRSKKKDPAKDEDGDVDMGGASGAKQGAAATAAAAASSPVDEPEEEDIGLETAQLRFMLQCHKSLVPNHKEVEEHFMHNIKLENMVEYYKATCEHGVLKLDAGLVASMTKDNKAKLAELEAKVEDAQENHGEIEVMEALLKIAVFRARTGTKEEALEAYRKVAELKSMSTGQLIDVVLKRILLGFFWMDTELVKLNIEEAEKLLEKGGDWDRRNRLKVYRALFQMVSRNFQKSSEDFLSAVATFTSTELCSYETFIFYTVMTSIVSLGRVDFKKKVIDSPEVLSVLQQVEHLGDFINTLHDCDYSGFFKSLVKMNTRICTDRYLHTHKDWFFREVRVLAYVQFLESYKSVTIDSMAKSFGVSKDFIDKELAHFISSQRINAKIDKAGGVIETSQPNQANARYQSVIRQGDLLLNRVQMLSRAINV
ncbi:26S proteasome non-ATPase regulatory subunit 6 homolog (26S proteasome regulatory subunit RPN7) (AtRPN7) (26S proteasome regulatory subunit S10 homolog) [Durusdinium trenchii]|uniref:26S proteasome non-ATPase regulatory subunit 6 homolog (26S proteasome regulatory subunit RPN7) (AtRPN7) (26S proteasome regulatory subunit S10 homolog) n=1 Tax=Durusdinium trenchii TaxID=1381693 RepID=A0ABP0KA67_9DINO